MQTGGTTCNLYNWATLRIDYWDVDGDGGGNNTINGTVGMNLITSNIATVLVDYVTMTDVTVDDGSTTWTAGGNSTDSGGNTGWIFGGVGGGGLTKKLGNVPYASPMRRTFGAVIS